MKDKTIEMGVFVRLKYIDMLQDWPAAVVLSQIHYWYKFSKKDGQSKLKVYKKGHWWIVKSHRGWWEDCRLTRRQVDRAINLLVARKLIEVKVMRYGRDFIDHGPPPVRHIRSLGFHLPEQSIAAPDGAVNKSTQKCNGTTIDYVQENTAEITKATASQKKEFENQEELLQGKKKVMVKVENKVIAMDSKEMLAKLKEKKLPAAEGPKNAAGLALAWQKLVPYYHDLPVLPGGLKIKPLTHKEIGMLAKYLKAVGKDEAYVVMHWSIQNWPILSISVKEQKGGTLPTQPGVNLLLRYYDIAVGCYKKSQQSPAKANSGPKLMSEAEQKLKLLVGK